MVRPDRPSDAGQPSVNAAHLDALVRQLVDTQEKERQRIARELHDQLGQHIVALSLGLARLASLHKGDQQTAELVAQLERAADLMGRDVHRLAIELRPAALDHLGLATAISNYAEDAARRSRIDIGVHCEDVGDLNLNADVQTGIYRIAQEAITNVVKHAAAGHASAILEHRQGALQLIVEDDGKGFIAEGSRGSGRLGLGLNGMKERATMIGGTLTIESAPGRGTTVFLRIPVSKKETRDGSKTALAAR